MMEAATPDSSPVLSAFMRCANDHMGDEFRCRLRQYAPRIVGANQGMALEQRRGWLAADWLIRVYAPAWLRAAGLITQAVALESADLVRDTESCKAVQPALDAAKNATKTAARNTAENISMTAVANAARNAASAATRDTARDAAMDAARVATRDAVRDAALYTAMDAAWGAARDAAWGAARDVAWDAIGRALEPTVLALQDSALILLDRMIECDMKKGFH